MNPIDDASSLFEHNHTCSQAVLMAFSDRFDLDREQARAIAAGFGAGMRSGCTCGALTGAIMVLGLVFAEEWNEESRQNVNNAVVSLRDRFVKLHGSDQCEALLGCNPTTTSGQKQAVVQGLFQSACPVFVRDTTRLTADILNEHGIGTN